MKPDSRKRIDRDRLSNAGSPNVLWIVTTQWRGQAAGFAGDPNARTPGLDALAKRSVVFENAVTPHPFGPFARAAMLTGRVSPENGVRDYFDPLPPDSPTIASKLKRRGYTTAWFGKWHLGPRDRNAPLVGPDHAKCFVPLEYRGGFDLWEGFEGGFLLNDPWIHGSRLPDPVSVPGYQSDVICRRAGNWLEKSHDENVTGPDKPWFCVISLEPPHPPYDAPAGDVASYDPVKLQIRANVPLSWEVSEKARAELSGYYAHIEATDRAVGRLLDGLDRESTAIFFTSVHGDMHGSHGLFRKGWPYEESIRVPLVVSLPGVEGRTDLLPASLIDLSSMTLAAAEGRKWSRNADHVAISMPSVVKLPHQCDRAWRGVRTGEWKVVFNTDRSPWLVFDLRDDPLELENLAAAPSAQEIIRWAGEIVGE